MNRLLLSILGISVCTTLSLFAGKSDSGCSKCKQQAQVAAYANDDDDDDDDDSDEGMRQQGMRQQGMKKNDEGMRQQGMRQQGMRRDDEGMRQEGMRRDEGMREESMRQQGMRQEGAVQAPSPNASPARHADYLETLRSPKDQKAYVNGLPRKQRDAAVREYNSRHPDSTIKP